MLLSFHKFPSSRGRTLAVSPASPWLLPKFANPQIIAKTIENDGNKDEQDKYVNAYREEVKNLVIVSDEFSKLLLEQRERTFNFSKKMIDESVNSASNSIYTIIAFILLTTIIGLIFVIITPPIK